MAQQAGPVGWDFGDPADDQERKDIKAQAKQFADLHMDAIGPLMQRIAQLKKTGQADDLYMMAAFILITGNNLLAYIKAAEAAARATAETN